jgi:hypothetical protein
MPAIRPAVVLPLLALVSGLQLAHAAPVLEAYAAAVAGQAVLIPPFGCATSAREVYAYGAGAIMPTEGYAACGIAGSSQHLTAAAGMQVASRDISHIFPDGSNFNGVAKARANYGVLGVSAYATDSGDTNSFKYHEAAAFARWQDQFTIASPGVSVGALGGAYFTFTIDGTLGHTAVPPYYAQTELDLYMNINTPGGNGYTIFKAQVLGSDLWIYNNGWTGSPGTTFGSINNAQATVGPFFFNFGAPFEIQVWMQTLGMHGCCFGTVQNMNFYSTAAFTGLAVYSQSGQVADFTVTSASGTTYTANGVQQAAVPEPQSWLLAGFGLLALRLRRRA